MPRAKQITLTLLTPALNNVCLDQTTAGAGSFTIAGSLASGGSVTLSTAHRLDIESVGNISGVTFTITGTNQDNVATTETIAGPNATTVTTTNYFKTITAVSVDGAVGTNTSIGTTDEALSQTYPTNRYSSYGTTVRADISGTINYTGQTLIANPQDSTHTKTWSTITGMSAQTADSTGTINQPIGAVRTVINSYSAGATCIMTVMEA